MVYIYYYGTIYTHTHTHTHTEGLQSSNGLNSTSRKLLLNTLKRSGKTEILGQDEFNGSEYLTFS